MKQRLRQLVNTWEKALAEEWGLLNDWINTHEVLVGSRVQ
jgi:hypothetical protein